MKPKEHKEKIHEMLDEEVIERIIKKQKYRDQKPNSHIWKEGKDSYPSSEADEMAE